MSCKCGYIPLGEFNTEIEILIPALNTSLLTASTDFTLLKKVRAKIETVNKSTEFFDGVNLSNSYTHKITIHYFTGISSRYFIRKGTVLYKIVDIENINENNKYLVFKSIQKGDQTIVSNNA